MKEEKRAATIQAEGHVKPTTDILIDLKALRNAGGWVDGDDNTLRLAVPAVRVDLVNTILELEELKFNELEIEEVLLTIKRISAMKVLKDFIKL